MNSYPAMPHIANGIEWLLQDLKPGKAPGPDGIHTYVATWTCPSEITPILHTSESFESGILPTDWCNANILYHFYLQKGDRKTSQPILLTSACCKLMEHTSYILLYS